MAFGFAGPGELCEFCRRNCNGTENAGYGHHEVGAPIKHARDDTRAAKWSSCNFRGEVPSCCPILAAARSTLPSVPFGPQANFAPAGSEPTPHASALQLLRHGLNSFSRSGKLGTLESSIYRIDCNLILAREVQTRLENPMSTRRKPNAIQEKGGRAIRLTCSRGSGIAAMLNFWLQTALAAALLGESVGALTNSSEGQPRPKFLQHHVCSYSDHPPELEAKHVNGRTCPDEADTSAEADDDATSLDTCGEPTDVDGSEGGNEGLGGLVVTTSAAMFKPEGWRGCVGTAEVPPEGVVEHPRWWISQHQAALAKLHPSCHLSYPSKQS